MRTTIACAWVLTVMGIVACDKPAETPTTAPKDSTPPVASSVPNGPVTVVMTGAKDDAVPVTTSNAEAREAYKKGLDLLDNVHTDDARVEFAKARKLDPKLWLAYAAEASTLPGPDGDKLIADAVANSGSLPEAEQLEIKFYQAVHAYDWAKGASIATKIAELLPKSWHAQHNLGWMHYSNGKFEESAADFKKAIAIDPNGAVACINWLGWIEMQQNKNAEALAHLQKFAELRPQEPNAHDSLGELYLYAGKYDEAAAAFEKATKLDPKFLMAYSGLGFVRLYKGDYAGAIEAFGKHRDGAVTVDDKGTALRYIALAQTAQNKAADAMKTLDAWDAAAVAAKDAEAGTWATIARASVLVETNKSDAALKLLADLGPKIDTLEAPAERKGYIHGYQHLWEAEAAARLGKAPETDKARAAAEEAVGTRPESELVGLVSRARGLALSTKGDAKAAVDAFKTCHPNDDYCAWHRSKAQEKAGDKTGAKATRDAIQKTHRRDPYAFLAYLHTK